MLAVATSFFSRTAISQSYNIGTAPTNTGSRASTPSPNAPASPPVTFTPTFNVGLWRVQSGSHKTTSKRVSVWSFEKRNPELEKLGALAKDRILEVLKAEASALGRLRHPSILEMVEPLEETRSELIFATEPLLSSLDLSIPGSPRLSHLVELDEVEIRKGILQICKGLSFLHTSAKLIHSNLCPESIVVNSAADHFYFNQGDWKIAGLGLTIPLLQPDGTPSRWEFPTFDRRVPAYIQRSFDYMAPEYALDEVLLTASDMYSLGCLIYAAHCKGNSPIRTHNNLAGLRENAGRPVPGMERLDVDLQDLIRSLITRHANSRPTPATLPSYPFFNSLPVSTLNFLDRSNFTSKSREEKVSFMKGLSSVLDKFSEGLRTRKILPSLLEEMKDSDLLPYILPNVFLISTALSSGQFTTLVLPSLRPLFAVKEPPQNMLTLLDNLHMLQSKTDKSVFREQVLPLVYNALQSEHAVVQERALKVVPELCDTIDYAEFQGVLFPRVALVFTKTRILSVKVATLVAFLSMVKTLDQTSLTQKLVPLLSRIRTKEPSVMLATLSVQEAMGFKVDREAVATLVLPQLWAMSMGPLLNLDQFQRFMIVIRKLGERVEQEHIQFLRDSQRLEDRSATTLDGATRNPAFGDVVDFETLVGGTNGITTRGETAEPSGWDEDDVWGSILNSAQTPSGTQGSSVVHREASSPPPPSKLGAKRIPPTSSATFGQVLSSSQPVIPSIPSTRLQSRDIAPSLLPPPHPTQAVPFGGLVGPAPLPGPSSQHDGSRRFASPPSYTTMTPTTVAATSAFPSASAIVPPPTMGSLLAPSKPPQPAWDTQHHKLTKDDPSWGDFDPLA